MDTPSPALYLVLVLLLVASAFFSASETAFSCVNRIRLKNLMDDGNEKAKLALHIVEDYDKMLATILIGNNVVNLSASSIATLVATALLGAAGAAISTIVLTLLVLAFGEILPKSFAKQNAESIVLRVAGPLCLLQTLLAPVAWLFIRLQRVVKPKNAESEPTVTEQELITIIQYSEEEGVLDKQESGILQSVLEFNDTTVQEILIPRVDMTTIDINDDLETILETAVAHGYSRLPVYRDSIDNIIGIVYGKDLLEAYIHQKELDIPSIMRECIYVYRSKPISELLNELKHCKQHMAIVTDEYGGTLGLITMEDILEELVGEIWDESDVVTHEVVRISDTCYEVQGDLNIADFFDEIGYSRKGFACDYSTVGGWVLEALEHIPQVGEELVLDTLRLCITKMDEQRIVRLRVELQAQAVLE